MAEKAVVFKGINFRRNKRDGYLEARLSLHRLIWILEYGAIPAGHHIHHKNHDRDDNRIENLECLGATAHAKYHNGKRLDLREAQSKWANSPKGREILRENMRKARRNMPRRSLTCGNCGKSFETKHHTQKFCSPACQESRNGLFIPCEICGKIFRAKKHKTRQVRTCSYRCGWDLRRKRASIQPND